MLINPHLRTALNDHNSVATELIVTDGLLNLSYCFLCRDWKQQGWQRCKADCKVFYSPYTCNKGYSARSVYNKVTPYSQFPVYFPS